MLVQLLYLIAAANLAFADPPQGNPPLQGKSPQGNSPQGNSPQGNSPQGNSPQDNSPQGNSPQGKPIFKFAPIKGLSADKTLFFMDISNCGPPIEPPANSSSALLPINMVQSPASIGGHPAGIEFQFNNYGQSVYFTLCAPFISASELDKFMTTFNPVANQTNGVCTVVLPWDLDNSLVANCFSKSENKLSGTTRFTAWTDTLSASGSYNLEFEFEGDALKAAADTKTVIGAMTASFTVDMLDYNSDGAGTLEFHIAAKMDLNSPANSEVRTITGLDSVPAVATTPKLTMIGGDNFKYNSTVTCIPSTNPNQVATFSYLGSARVCIKSDVPDGDSEPDCDKRVPQHFQITFSLDSACKVSYKIKSNIVSAAVTDLSHTTKLFAPSTWKLALTSDFLKAAGFRIDALSLTITYKDKTATVDPNCLSAMFQPLESDAGNTILTFFANPLDKAAVFPTDLGCASGKLDAFVMPNVGSYRFGVNMRFMDSKVSRRDNNTAGNTSSIPATGGVSVTVTTDGSRNLASSAQLLGSGLAAVAAVAAVLSMNRVLVTVREGRNFSPVRFDGGGESRLYLQCRFNNEILTTDPVPFDEEPVWDTDLAWDISHKPLAFLRTQRAKLKLVCYAIDALNRRVQVGYVMLDLRTAASAVSSDLNAPLESGKENPSVWYPLLNVNTTKKTPMSVFKPELKIAFVIIQKVGNILFSGFIVFIDRCSRVLQIPPAATGSIPPISKQKRLKNLNIPSSAVSPKPMLISSPKAIRIQLYPDGATQPPSPAYQFNQNQTLFTTTSGLPIELTPTGCYQIGFNGPNWLLNFTIAFAENLAILRPHSLDSNAVATTPVEGYYFSYSFLGNTITTTPFPNLSKPSFPSERISFRIRASEHDFSQFLADVEVLVVSLCQEPGGEVIGYAEVPLMGVMADADEKSRDLATKAEGLGVVEAAVGGFRKLPGAAGASISRSQSPGVNDMLRSSLARSIMANQEAHDPDTEDLKRRQKILETVVTFHDAKQQLPVSVDGKVAGLGISVIVSPDFQSDLIEAETGGLQRHLLGGAETEGYDENEFEEYDHQEVYDEQVKPVVSGSPELLGRRLVDPRHGAESPDLKTDMPVPQSPPIQTSFQQPAISQTEEFAKYTQQNQIPAMNAANLQMDQISQQRQPDLSRHPATKNQSLPAAVPKPAPWHQYRFSIDLRSICGIHPAHGPIFLKYSYAPFGTTAPITTYPPVKPTNPIATTSTHKPARLDLPNSFCAFEFVMGAERLLTYLEAVPLAIEVWNTDAYEKNVQIGVATVDLSAVCLKERKVVYEPVQ
ncbi:hypothetical protein HDU80_009890, partial [Chytriomyces hyalinus]